MLINRQHATHSELGHLHRAALCPEHQFPLPGTYVNYLYIPGKRLVQFASALQCLTQYPIPKLHHLQLSRPEESTLPGVLSNAEILHECPGKCFRHIGTVNCVDWYWICHAPVPRLQRQPGKSSGPATQSSRRPVHQAARWGLAKDCGWCGRPLGCQGYRGCQGTRKRY